MDKLYHVTEYVKIVENPPHQSENPVTQWIIPVKPSVWLPQRQYVLFRDIYICEVGPEYSDNDDVSADGGETDG